MSLCLRQTKSLVCISVVVEVRNWCYSEESCVSCRERTSAHDLHPLSAFQEFCAGKHSSSLKSVGFEQVPKSPRLRLCLCSDTSPCRV